MENHTKYMNIALSVAKRGLGITAPNPTVGCVIVKNDIILASGFTSKDGRPHAEVNALQKTNDAKGADLYVTLEPCCHHGKTPPCTDAIIKAGIKRVIIACTDPYKKVAGGGIAALKSAGIEVVIGICEKEAISINAGFFKVQHENIPYITLKIAASKDGKIAAATGEQTQITGEVAQRYSHYLRSINDAILVGVDTAIIDNPTLNCRLSGLDDYSPVRIVLDSKGRLPESSNLVKTADKYPLWIFYSEADSHKNYGNAKVIQTNSLESGLDLKKICTKLADMGITRLLVEGGAKVVSSFIKANLVDELIYIQSPEIIGEKGVDAFDGSIDIESQEPYKSFALGNDSIFIYNLSFVNKS